MLLSDACVDNKLTLMAMPQDLDAAFRKFIPPFGAAGNPVDITGGEPPTTYKNTIKLGLEDERIHSLILGYWHTIVTPPMVFAELTARVVAEFRAIIDATGVHPLKPTPLPRKIMLEVIFPFWLDMERTLEAYKKEGVVVVGLAADGALVPADLEPRTLASHPPPVDLVR